MNEMSAGIPLCDLTVQQLQSLLSKYGLSTSGLKPELQQRLKDLGEDRRFRKDENGQFLIDYASLEHSEGSYQNSSAHQFSTQPTETLDPLKLRKLAADIPRLMERDENRVEDLLSQLGLCKQMYGWTDEATKTVLAQKLSAQLYREVNVLPTDSWNTAAKKVRSSLGLDCRKIESLLENFTRRRGESCLDATRRLFSLLENPASSYSSAKRETKITMVRSALRKVLPNSLFLLFLVRWGTEREPTDSSSIITFIRELTDDDQNNTRGAANDTETFPEAQLNYSSGRKCLFCDAETHLMPQCPVRNEVRKLPARVTALENRLTRFEEKIDSNFNRAFALLKNREVYEHDLA